jgi:hypothetical protein
MPASVPSIPDVKLTAPMVRALQVLSSDFRADSPMTALRADAFLGLSLLTRPQIADFSPFRGPGARGISVPGIVAGFFIEAFAIDQPRAARCLLEKSFPSTITLRFALPATVPISVRTVGAGKLEFGFYDTPVMTVDETLDRVDRILKLIAAKEMYVVEFTNVDSQSFTNAEIASFADEYEVVLLKSDGALDRELETQNFTLRVLKTNLDPGFERELREGFANLHQMAYVTFCLHCRLLYSPGEASPCRIFRHKGRQLPLPSGEMEEVEDSEDGPIVILNWSCCGERAADEPGCEEIDRGPHEPDPARTDHCKFTVSTSFVFRK